MPIFINFLLKELNNFDYFAYLCPLKAGLTAYLHSKLNNYSLFL